MKLLNDNVRIFTLHISIVAMGFIDSRIYCIADKIASSTQNGETCTIIKDPSISRIITTRRINPAFYLVNIVTTRFRRNPWDDLVRKKARSTCWKGVFTGEESSRRSYESFNGSWRPWGNLRAGSIRIEALVRCIRYGEVLIECCRNSANAYAWFSAK